MVVNHMFKYIYFIITVFCIFFNAICYAAQTSAILQHTSVIGTDINPTVDGGIISSTDDLPVYHPQIIKFTSVRMPEVMLSKNMQSINESTQPFNDNWATSEKVSRIFDNAIQSGKLQFILQQSKNLNLPASVVIIPLVESNYKDNAISPKGAVGTWQLMPSTAIEYGLNPSQRIQFVPETNAALMLLRNLHQQFGNWELAFAAYNAGSARIINALKKNPNATTIDELNIPTETKNYVASIHQINDVLTNLNPNFLHT